MELSNYINNFRSGFYRRLTKLIGMKIFFISLMAMRANQTLGNQQQLERYKQIESMRNEQTLTR